MKVIAGVRDEELFAPCGGQLEADQLAIAVDNEIASDKH
jgi:hypothetical protein